MKDLLSAFRPVAVDMASSFLLIILVALHATPPVALGVAAAFAVLQIAVMLARRTPVAPLQWASLALVLLFGGAGLVFHDMRFLMAKPTVVELIVAVVFLQRGWMLRYLPPIAAERGRGLAIAWGYVWAAFMASLAMANLAVAILWPANWVIFKSTVPTFGPLVLFLLQYGSMRFVIRRRMIAEAQLQAA